MMGRTHAIGGLASLWMLQLVPGAITTASDGSNLGLLAVCAVFGALFPDLDAPKSLLSLWSFNKKGIRPFSLPAQELGKVLAHRGLLHSLIGGAISTLIVGLPLMYYFGWQSVLAFFLGFISHLLLDCMTVTGLAPFWPSKRVIWILPKRIRITTGSPLEDIVFALLSLLVVVLLFINFPIG
jgi:membrane-bound metal-dependent hydrolase YbcI (DUF457 family)